MQTRVTPSQRPREDAFAEENLSAEGSGSVAESGDRHDEAHGRDGKSAEQCEEGDGHQADAEPHPRDLNGAKGGFDESRGAEIFYFADDFHGASDAEFAGGAADDDQGEGDSDPEFLCHESGCSVVRAGVRPTTKTPRQMTRTPSQRSGERRVRGARKCRGWRRLRRRWTRRAGRSCSPPRRARECRR